MILNLSENSLGGRDTSENVVYSASKNTDSSVFYTEIETKILNTHFDQKIQIVAITCISV